VTLFLQYTFNGLITGVVYSLIAVGLTLGIGVARFFNFAQGQLVILAVFLGAVLSGDGVPYYAVVPIVLAAVAGVGLAIRTVIHRVAGTDSLVVFLGTLGFGIIIQTGIVLIWGAEQRSIAPPFTGEVVVDGVIMPQAKLMLLAITVPVVAALYAILARTEAGHRMRACAENPTVSALLGINVQRTMRVAVAIGSGLAALAGVVIGTLFPFDPFGGGGFLIKGIAVALVGGLGSISGAVICGLALGLIETYAAAYGINLGFFTIGQQWQDGYAFVLMIAVLALRPQGIFRGTGDLS